MQALTLHINFNRYHVFYILTPDYSRLRVEKLPVADVSYAAELKCVKLRRAAGRRQTPGCSGQTELETVLLSAEQATLILNMLLSIKLIIHFGSSSVSFSDVCGFMLQYFQNQLYCFINEDLNYFSLFYSSSASPFLKISSELGPFSLYLV